MGFGSELRESSEGWPRRGQPERLVYLYAGKAWEGVCKFLIVFKFTGRGAEGQFRGFEVEVGFGGHFHRFSEGSGGFWGRFREAKRKPKSIFWRFFPVVFRDRDSGGIFSEF